VYDLTRSDLAYYYKSCIDGIEATKKAAWREYSLNHSPFDREVMDPQDAEVVNNNIFVAKSRNRLLALRLIKDCEEARFSLFKDGLAVMSMKLLEARLEKLELPHIEQLKE
jgi:hypothetical protein